MKALYALCTTHHSQFTINTMNKIKLFSLQLSRGPYPEFVRAITEKAARGESDYTCVANVHMLVEAYKSASFAQTVNNAAIVTPDGKPLTWALKLMHGLRQDRVAGMDLLPALLSNAAEKNIPVFFYGGSNDMLDKTALYMRKNFPALMVAGLYSPPFRPLTPTEENKVVERINSSGAKLLFVALGCPKQERWMESMKGRVNAFMVGIGGALPVLVGDQKRAPRWMQNGGLEWLYRLGQEPRRLFQTLRRYQFCFPVSFRQSLAAKKNCFPA